MSEGRASTNAPIESRELLVLPRANSEVRVSLDTWSNGRQSVTLAFRSLASYSGAPKHVSLLPREWEPVAEALAALLAEGGGGR